MTGSIAVGKIDARRLGVGVLAFVVALSLHLLGWLALRSASMAERAARLPAADTARRALSVELIPLQAPAQPRRAPATIAPVRGRTDAAASGGARPLRDRDASMTTRVPARSSAAATRMPKAEAVSAPESSPADAPAPGVDWRGELDAIGAPRTVGRSPAAATISGLGASSGMGTGVSRRATTDATLARGMSEARRADCRNAYAGMGLLAIPALAIDAVRDAGCKW
ncbi:hypothetical protein BGV52_14385 [Burkholderia ubonensis]|uniref:Uncharacterized protein n=1 Tax=Burkholderia ubonensis TaxID=101571 RepID=A0A103PS73_9BURK|nr:hypothetical protein [Burkholderia ubonensis]KVG36197.1 hypothetical protein WJ31_19945 [Burkholderia ubonensis]KVP69834.1 hypothetical protein WJ93_16530 [Burkholderia ubonensis]KVQ97776.1 hypothetical protein WK08_04865 [Burkholderia ubonensis]KVW60862.1 hypothetical protein WK99_16165 [Burkholderia ubonensis]KWA77972.1 hypothetical protein WL29_33805 [Burkholderia ubonensis]